MYFRAKRTPRGERGPKGFQRVQRVPGRATLGQSDPLPYSYIHNVSAYRALYGKRETFPGIVYI